MSKEQISKEIINMLNKNPIIFHKYINKPNYIKIILYYLLKNNFDLYKIIINSKDKYKLYEKIINKYPLSFNKILHITIKKTYKIEKDLFNTITFFFLSKFNIKYIILQRKLTENYKNFIDKIGDNNIFYINRIDNRDHIIIYYKRIIYDPFSCENNLIYSHEETCLFNCLCFILDKILKLNVNNFLICYNIIKEILYNTKSDDIYKINENYKKYLAKNKTYKKFLKLLEREVELGNIN